MIETEARPAVRRELGLAGLFDIALGYERAQVLFTANELGVFDALAAGPKSLTELAAAIGASERGLSPLLEACVALALVRVPDGRYENSRTAGLFLRSGSDGSFAPVLRFWREFSYGAWGRLPQAVRENRPQTASGPKSGDLFEALLEDPAQCELFFDGLSSLAYWPAQRIAELVDFGTRRHLVDVGGGSGAYSAVIASRHRHLKVTVFDLEPVCALARQRFRRIDPDGRLTAVAGDFHHDDLPSGADCALVSNVLHDWSPAECRALLARVADALPPGGEVIVYDLMPAADRPSLEAALFSLALLLDTSRGQTYTRNEIEGWLHESGFEDIRAHVLAGASGILTGSKRR